MVITQDPAEVLDWDGGTLNSRRLIDFIPIAAVPSGTLMTTGGETATQLYLFTGSPAPQTSSSLVTGVATTVAVSSGGDRVSVVTGTGTQRRLRELALPSGRELRSVSIGPPLAETTEGVLPVAYSGESVLLTIGDGDARRTAVWESGNDQVIGELSGFTDVLGGGPDEGSSTGRAAMAGGACKQQIVRLSNGMPSWDLCRERFVGFSPDGETVLATNATSDALVVHDADDGDIEQEFRAPEGLRAYGWESNDTVLYTTLDGNSTVVIRCGVPSGDCVTAATFPSTDRIPQPVTRYGN